MLIRRRTLLFNTSVFVFKNPIKQVFLMKILFNNLYVFTVGRRQLSLKVVIFHTWACLYGPVTKAVILWANRPACHLADIGVYNNLLLSGVMYDAAFYYWMKIGSWKNCAPGVDHFLVQRPTILAYLDPCPAFAVCHWLWGRPLA